ncbi:protein kinase-like domain-containing protein [Artemisia annua]|uniref:Protein kinase-like domain-containing protein n=1 Tax=Artemisia annua TaxID=35608 RepID=A0A2U1M1B4_ARTAN|nr:protein kinase-like domain-containing protein [Artemisia annua]
MLTGKKLIDTMFEEGLSLHSYARTALDGDRVLMIVDPMLLHDDVNEMWLCSSESPQDRMDIETIVHELNGHN